MIVFTFVEVNFLASGQLRVYNFMRFFQATQTVLGAGNSDYLTGLLTGEAATRWDSSNQRRISTPPLTFGKRY